MILTEPQIKTILTTKPNSALWSRAQSFNKELCTHFYGTNMEAKLQTIDGYEKEAMRKERVKYAKSNKDLFSRLSRPIDKVFSARGGSIYYNMGDQQDKLASSLAADVRDGLSCKKWIESYWKPHFLDDPMGMIFMEIDNTGRVYPTYKSSTSIVEGMPRGVHMEYVVFSVSKSEKKRVNIDESWTVYRIIDDAFDYYVRVDDGNITILKDHTYPNYFMVVPAILNSDIADPEMQDCYLSMFNDVIDLANHFLLKGSIKVTHEFLHGFPKYWEYADDCITCKGTGYVESKDCHSCKGTGKKLMTKVSDVKLMSYPDSKESPIVTPNVAGYVEPSKIYFELVTSDLEALEDAMTFTLWGTHRKQAPSDGSKQPETATASFLDVQPVQDRLSSVSESAEKRHKFIIDFKIGVELRPGYQGASINYGRRYLIESPDAIWQRYTDARQKGSPVGILDDMLVEFYETKYNGDPLAMAIKIKLMSIEPMVHYAVSDIIDWPVTPLEKQRKCYFGDWLATMTKTELIVKTSDQLKQSLTDYVIKVSESDDGKDDKTPLAVKLGVDGTQSLQLILGDPNIDKVSKQNILQILFGITPEDAQKMVAQEIKKEPVTVPVLEQ